MITLILNCTSCLVSVIFCFHHHRREKVPSSTQWIQLLAMGQRFTAAEALSEGLIHATAPATSVMDKAKEIARDRLKLGPLPRWSCENIKLDLYRDLIKRANDFSLMEQTEIPRPKL